MSLRYVFETASSFFKKQPVEAYEENQEKELIRAYFNNRQGGVFVEVGANEPIRPSSQSWHLENQLNWTGILIEPEPELAEKARQTRPGSVVCQCACTSPDKTGHLSLYIPVRNGQPIVSHAAVEKNIDVHNYSEHHEVRVPARSLNDILEENQIDRIDFLSIDVEGAELDVLKGFDLEKYRPALILLEDKHVALTKHRYLKKRGYKLVKRTKQNCWYIPKGAKGPPQSLKEKIRLLKRMYISIWWKKSRLALRSRT